MADVMRVMTKSEAIDEIQDIEHLRRVAHRMWEAFYAAHSQTSHAVAALLYGGCADCNHAMTEAAETECDEWLAWQKKVTAGFGSV